MIPSVRASTTVNFSILFETCSKCSKRSRTGTKSAAWPRIGFYVPRLLAGIEWLHALGHCIHQATSFARWEEMTRLRETSGTRAQRPVIHGLSLVGEGGESGEVEVTARVAQDTSLASRSLVCQSSGQDFDDHSTAVEDV